MMEQVLQIVGALAILAAFVGIQTKRLAPDDWASLALNAAGAALLAVLAALDRDWGFLLLEASWAAVSLASAVQKVRAVR